MSIKGTRVSGSVMPGHLIYELLFEEGQTPGDGLAIILWGVQQQLYALAEPGGYTFAPGKILLDGNVVWYVPAIREAQEHWELSLYEKIDHIATLARFGIAMSRDAGPALVVRATTNNRMDARMAQILNLRRVQQARCCGNCIHWREGLKLYTEEQSWGRCVRVADIPAPALATTVCLWWSEDAAQTQEARSFLSLVRGEGA